MVTNNERKTDGKNTKRKNPFIKRFLIVITAMVLLFSFTCIAFGQSSETTFVFKDNGHRSRPFRASSKVGSSVTTEIVYGKGIRKQIKDTTVSKPNKATEQHVLETVYCIPEETIEQENETPSVPFSTNVYASDEVYVPVGYFKDGSKSVKLKLAIAYEITHDKYDRPYLRVTQAAGKLTSLTGHSGSVQGSGVSIVGNGANLAVLGKAQKGKGLMIKEYSTTLPNKPSGWKYKTPADWLPICYFEGAPTHIISLIQTVTLKRGNQKWYLEGKLTVY